MSSKLSPSMRRALIAADDGLLKVGRKVSGAGHSSFWILHKSSSIETVAISTIKALEERVLVQIPSHDDKYVRPTEAGRLIARRLR